MPLCQTMWYWVRMSVINESCEIGCLGLNIFQGILKKFRDAQNMGINRHLETWVH